MPTARLRTSCAAASLLLASACATPPIGGATATEAARCEAWQASLPTRSHQDTAQTQAEIGHAYDVFEAACLDRQVRAS